MSDIVERLRQWSDCYGVQASAEMKEAAAEIERLRAALRDARALVLEEAAKVADHMQQRCREAEAWGQDPSGADAAEDIALSIRAMAKP